jgi:hypothetical protein
MTEQENGRRREEKRREGKEGDKKRKEWKGMKQERSRKRKINEVDDC